MSDELTDPLNDPIHATTIARLATDFDAPAPPSGLALRTVSRLAEVLVADCTSPTLETIVIPSSAVPRIESDAPVYFGKRRADLSAACVSFLGVGLMITGVQVTADATCGTARTCSATCTSPFRTTRTRIKAGSRRSAVWPGRRPGISRANWPVPAPCPRA